ncbi:hypothetical protein F5Y03DRAFT_249326 [Xylaria venustula]|nr:hypothetical protein F5Y03DRAFT_249326 [Xylaria venustula]
MDLLTHKHNSVIFVHGLQGHPLKTWAAEVGHQNGYDGKRQSEHKSPDLDKIKAQSKGKSILSRVRKLKLTRDSETGEGHTRVFWPADLLPMKLPTARILVFGYDTVIVKHQFAGAVNKNSVFAHSKDLVNELSRARPLGRPIIFVTHSLGGIVVKESLAICSTSNSENVEDILKSTTGVMFLGTPHRGSSAAGVGEIARKAAGLLLMDTNSRLLDSLSLRNSDLERCQDVFSSLWLKYNFQVKTFQEGLPLKLPIRLGQSKMVKVVPDISSCLGDSRERAETLDGDHRSMCRFKGLEDRNYIKVAAELHAMYTNLTPKAVAITLDERFNGIKKTHHDQGKLEHLKFTEAFFRQLSICAPAENTCQWLRDTESFAAWIERVEVDSHFGLLQIIGKPGSGKSTLMKEAFEATRVRFRDHTGICVLNHFFDRSGQLLQHSSNGVFRSLLYQLGNQYPTSLTAFRDYTQADLKLLESSDSKSYVNMLKSRLEEVFSDRSLAPRRTIIFIDALDECDSADAMNVGYSLAQLTRKAYKNEIQLDICISRREYPSITVQGSLEIRMETYNDVDIQHYIQQKFELGSICTRDRDLLTRTIFERSNGIFLWVVLAVEGVLQGVENGENTKFILKRTESLPRTLEILYAQIISDMDPGNRKLALRLFQWAVLATERLRIREWHHILAFIREKPPRSLKEWRDSDYYTENDAQLERRIRSLSQGLIEVKIAVDNSTAASDCGSLRAGAGSLDSNLGDSRIVQPIHETVTEFFTKNIGGNFLGCGHLSIASTCLAYLDITELDGLVRARQRLEHSSVSDLGDRIARGREQIENSTPKRRRRGRRRSRSATSFMSSASSHSGRYRFESDSDESIETRPRYEDTSNPDSLYIRKELQPPQYHPKMPPRMLVPSTPADFALLFPSLDPFTIRHDDSASDGNMNLVVSTSVPIKSGKLIQLFHLRIYDLFRRELSLRRYCRDSGREVGRSRRKYAESDTRPILRGLFEDAIGRAGGRSTDHEMKPDIIDAQRSLAARSGYSPWVSVDNNIGEIRCLKPTDVYRLEFSNYACIEMHYAINLRRRTYSFSYWEADYTWKSVVDDTLVSFHLFENSNRKDPLALITPVVRSPEEIENDELAGTWVPPHLMRLTDKADLKNTDLADVIMATGLTVLVDGCITALFEDPKKGYERAKSIGSSSGRPRPACRSPHSNHAVEIGSPSSNSSLSWSLASHPFESQTLEEYPALTSYALNRVFVHAGKGLAMSVCPDEFLRKLILEKAWERWYVLQEGASGYRTWQGMLTFQGLEPWIDVANNIIKEVATTTEDHQSVL